MRSKTCTRCDTPDSELERRFREILDGIERPDLLLLAILLHDVGKGMQVDDHVAGSLQAAAAVLDRLRLEPAERETVTFLIANHLRMSATTRRQDIFDPKVVAEFSEAVGTTEQLKMLTLLTYTDVKSVNPEALTPWKAELLWQLYAAAFNHLSRTVDDQRLTANTANSERIKEVVAAAGEIDAKAHYFVSGRLSQTLSADAHSRPKLLRTARCTTGSNSRMTNRRSTYCVARVTSSWCC